MLTVFLKVAIPAIFTALAGYIVLIVNNVFAGKIDNDPKKLAAVGLS